MRFIKQLAGPYVELVLLGKKDEVINWRNYFFNWAAIKINEGCYDFGESLDRQEKEEIQEVCGSFLLKIFVRKNALINAFKNSMEARVNWEKVSLRGGRRARLDMHKRVERAALRRFEAIPTPGLTVET